MALLLDYRLNDATVANPDGSFPIQLSDVTAVPGAVESRLGRLEGALDLGASG